jgi:hypothetical protein
VICIHAVRFENVNSDQSTKCTGDSSKYCFYILIEFSEHYFKDSSLSYDNRDIDECQSNAIECKIVHLKAMKLKDNVSLLLCQMEICCKPRKVVDWHCVYSR